ncbi:MAG: hypothetical protein JW722_00675 [Demequinaceae bacterium]|nr:hypothetical protein [Demequinaceae bacterium]
MRTPRLYAFFGVCVAVALMASSCSENVPDSEYLRQHSQVASIALEEARAQGVNADQLAVIESVAESGRDVTYTEYHDAALAMIECLEAAGFAIDGPWDQRHQGQDYVSFGYSPPEGWSERQMDDVYGGCAFRHFAYVDMLYQTNTIAKEYVDDAFTRALPEIITCLAEYGYEIPGDAPMDEVGSTVVEVVGLYGDEADCYTRSGFTAALNG